MEIINTYSSDVHFKDGNTPTFYRCNNLLSNEGLYIVTIN